MERPAAKPLAGCRRDPLQDPAPKLLLLEHGMEK
jgi:hypothetical protein